MLSYAQKKHILDAIPTTLCGRQLPVYRQEDTIPDIPNVPFIVYGIISQGVDLGFFKTQGPINYYFDKELGVIIAKHGVWLKSTISVGVVSANGTELDKLIDDLAGKIYPGHNRYFPIDSGLCDVRFMGVISCEEIKFQTYLKSAQKNVYVSTLDFEIWYLRSWIIDGPPILDAGLRVTLPGTRDDAVLEYVASLHTKYYELEMRVV